MRVKPTEPPRKFGVGLRGDIILTDCAHIELDANEQVTFLSPDGNEYDVVRKPWGYYATPSINGRLRDNGYRTALVENSNGRFYIMLVEESQLSEFEQYCLDDEQRVVEWLDDRRSRK